MTFWSALILGVLASVHCAGMCGGLQVALQPRGVIRSERERLIHLLILNGGRLTTYVAVGALFSIVGVTLIKTIDVPQLSQAMRSITACILVALGTQMLISSSKPFFWAERLGSRLWNGLNGFIRKEQNSRVHYSFVRGIIWGFLPCGLVYGVLFTTLFSDSALNSTLVMLGFGLGTLPAMLLTGGLYQSLRRLMQHKAIRWGGGALFIQGGVLMLLAPWLINMDFMQAYPQLMSSIFCIN